MQKLPILVILTERQHTRLSNQIKRIQTCSMDVADLYKYRDNWLNNLGYDQYLPYLIQAIDTLISSLENGEYDQSLYEELAIQVYMYQKSCWHTLHTLFPKANSYQDRWMHVKKHYKDRFREEFESNRNLTVQEQAKMMKAILKGKTLKSVINIGVQPDRSKELIKELGIVRSNPISKIANNVVDFFKYKRNKD